MGENVPEPYVYMIIRPKGEGFQPSAKDGVEDLYVGSTKWFTQTVNRHSKPSPSGTPAKYDYQRGTRWIMAMTPDIDTARGAEWFLWAHLDVPENQRAPSCNGLDVAAGRQFLWDHVTDSLPAWATSNHWYQEMWHCVATKAFRHAGLEPPELATPFCTGRMDGCPRTSAAALASATNTSRSRSCGRCNEGRQLPPH